ncbi:endonuclease exonuclease phosphatase family protein [Colletotrichum truncatum]|uniref:Endonuclease exonuclease phosphatase family protein n=1 Tax=Colletotrichum truncatum TaxID=5467 RepID=A0ACC3Z026_COLTU
MLRRLFFSTDHENPTYKPIYQSWHEYNHRNSDWEPVSDSTNTNAASGPHQQDDRKHEFTLASWNVDAFSPLPNDRLSAILSSLFDNSPSPDIIFLQEVCKPMISCILEDQRVRNSWYCSEKDGIGMAGHLFMTVTLISKSRFGPRASFGSLGKLSRIKYHSRYGRDALCSEVNILSSGKHEPKQPEYRRIQLINVHLDSLALTPSYRPRQLSVVATLLHEAGHGLVAGDFNPVLPEDQTLIEENNLIDAWKAVHGDEPGYTWGVDGNEPFPPNRMDRIAMIGLEPFRMEVMRPGKIPLPKAEHSPSKASSSIEAEEDVPWSDHSGLKCTFSVG